MRHPLNSIYQTVTTLSCQEPNHETEYFAGVQVGRELPPWEASSSRNHSFCCPFAEPNHLVRDDFVMRMLPEVEESFC